MDNNRRKKGNKEDGYKDMQNKKKKNGLKNT